MNCPYCHLEETGSEHNARVERETAIREANRPIERRRSGENVKLTYRDGREEIIPGYRKHTDTPQPRCQCYENGGCFDEATGDYLHSNAPCLETATVQVIARDTDAFDHEPERWVADHLACRACGVRWEAPDLYRLEILSGEEAADA